MEMTERKKKILKTIVNEYIMTAQPVGSRTLARKYDFGVSSATIRNEMADLEAAGYLEQPHKSAGRVPSDKGYRFYVDSLMDVKGLSEEEARTIRKDYSDKETEIQDLMRHTSNLLSDLTRYTSLAVSPELKESIFRNLKLVPVAENKILIVLVTDTGVIKDKIIELPEKLSEKDLAEVERILNDRLSGTSLYQINEQLLSNIASQLAAQISIGKENINLIKQELFTNEFSSFGQVYLGGTTYILDQPEFSDLNKVKNMLSMLEHKQIVKDILDEGDQSELEIVIGHENEYEDIKDCSIVIATYKLNGRPVGKLGVLGPTRMQYSKATARVKFMADLLSNLLTD
ncbi:MAG: heat-inducible transcriptional repressor HrcA [Bacillota bacterium]